MPGDIEQEIKEASIQQAKDMHMEALRKFGEDFGIDMRTELSQTTTPMEIADDFPGEEAGEEDDQDST